VVECAPMPDPTGTRWPLEPDPEELRRLIEACAAFVVEHVETLPSQPSFDTDGAGAVAASFREPVPESGRRLASILGRLRPPSPSRSPRRGRVSRLHPRRRHPGRRPGRLRGLHREPLTWGWRPPLRPGADRGHHHRLARLPDGYPATSGGILTSGGSLSNLTAVVTARTAKLGEDFLSGTLYFSEEIHLSVVKAARIAGFSERNFRWIPVDARFRMVPDRLEEAVREDRARASVPSWWWPASGPPTPAPWILFPRSWTSLAATISGCTPTPPTAASSGWCPAERR